MRRRPRASSTRFPLISLEVNALLRPLSESLFVVPVLEIEFLHIILQLVDRILYEAALLLPEIVTLLQRCIAFAVLSMGFLLKGEAEEREVSVGA